MSCNTKQLKPGIKFSRTSYGEIVSVSDAITVRNEQGVEWSIDPEIFAQEFFTPDQFDDAFELTRTDLIDELIKQSRIIVSVHFTKKPEHKKLVDVVEKLLEGGDFGSLKLSKILKDATAGEERTMIGRHYGEIDEFGRLKFIDMENGGIRLVDPRTIEWFIAGNAKYVLK